MKTLFNTIMVGCCMLFVQHGYGQNYALSFQAGQEDFVQLDLLPTSLSGNPANFTVECWFNNSNTIAGNFRRIFTLGGVATRIEVGVRNGQLTYFIQGMFPGAVNLTVVNPNTWYHLAVVKTGDQFDFYLDCNLVGSSPATPITYSIDFFRLGRWAGGAAAGADWDGLIDDVRIWTTPLTPTEICARQNCPLSCQEPNLFLNWTFDNPVVVPSGNNTALTQVLDCTANAYHGSLGNFLLNGPTSNFVNSTAPLVFPALHDLGLEIRDYPYRNNLLTGICEGEPVHICLDDNGQTPGPYANVAVLWQFSDDGGSSWNPVATPSFLDFCFPVAPNEILVPCPGNSAGFVDRKYRAVSTVTGPTSAQCTYVSEEYDLQICCPISTPTISVVPSGPYCEGDTETFAVSMTSPDPFVTTPGPFVTIDWYFVDPFNNSRTLVHSGAGGFNYTHTFPTVAGVGPGPHDYCFEVEITNCQGKFGLFSACVQVDPQPECGTIEGSPLGSPQNLILVGTSPQLSYEICPGNDAILEMATPFIDCIPQWQYTFDDPNVVTNPTWVNVGFSNSIQNTNILPSYYWPAGATCIYYRVECQPLSSPSGCDPCYSAWVEICLIQPPAIPIIGGMTQVCLEDLPLPLSVTNPVAGISYTWYLDGLVVGNGTTHLATAGGCYWVEASNGCQTVTSAQHCVVVCETIATISCPLSPNECAKLGDPITLSACGSRNTCSGNTGNSLTYVWSTGDTTCSISHTPAATGTTYTVTVTDPTTGCVGIAQRTVVPCDLNE